MKQHLMVCLLLGSVAVQVSPARAKRLSDFLPAGKPPSKTAEPQSSPRPASSQAQGSAVDRLPDPRKALEAHGVTGGKKELIAFLNQGLPSQVRGRLPAEPAEKCQLAIDAMARLAKLKAREAVPVLIEIASLQLPKGVESLLEMDLAKTSPESRAEYRNTAAHLLQFNAVNALGLIGDPAGDEVVRAVFAQEPNSAARIQHALSLACLGDASGVDYLVEEIDKQNRRESAAAAKVFTFITGQDFGYTQHTAVRARRARARQYRDWWRENRSRFAVDPSEVMKRRFTPQTPLPYQPRNTRDLLKLAACYFDFDNSLGSRDARVRIKQGGRSLNSELQRIAQDTMEDLDVRMEAMNWYYEINRGEARSLLTRLRRDENPEIKDKADTLLEQIDDPNTAQRMSLSQ